jgi:AcrR family transcriptional regulator
MNTAPDEVVEGADWHRRVVNRSLRTATRKSIDRGASLVKAAATLLERSNGDGFTVQDVANEAGQSLRTLYQYFESKDDLLLAVFEEAMRTYALMIRDAIAGLTDPLERLAGALIAAVRLPEHSETAITKVFTRLHLQLAQVEPVLVDRSQAPATMLLRELIDAASADGSVRTHDSGAAAFFLLSLTTASINHRTLGNGARAVQPEPLDVVTFCLQGLGAGIEPGTLDAIAPRLALPKRPIRSIAFHREAT